MPRSDRSEKIETIPVTENVVIKLSVGYEEGGTNWFNGYEQRQGLYLYGMVGRLSEGIFSCVVGSGGEKVFLEPLTRFNRKKLEAWAERMKNPENETRKGLVDRLRPNAVSLAPRN